MNSYVKKLNFQKDPGDLGDFLQISRGKHRILNALIYPLLCFTSTTLVFGVKNTELIDSEIHFRFPFWTFFKFLYGKRYEKNVHIIKIHFICSLSVSYYILMFFVTKILIQYIWLQFIKMCKCNRMKKQTFLCYSIM